MCRGPQRSRLHAWRTPGTRQALCQDIENTHGAAQDTLTWERPRLCLHGPHTVVTRRSTHPWPTRRARTSGSHWSARTAGSRSGGRALLPPLPPGGRNGPPAPSTPRRQRPHTSSRPSCPCACYDAKTAQAGARRPSGTGAPSQGESPYPHAAPWIVFDAATARRCTHTRRAHPCWPDLSSQAGPSRHRCQRFPCAAPHPRLPPHWRTGTRSSCLC